MVKTFILIGRSGCGKGTQAELLKNYIATNDDASKKVLYVETGELFRELIKGPNFSSRLSKEIYENDKRQPDFLACAMWSKILVEHLDEDSHLIIDGAPRSLPEATLLTTAMEFYKRERPVVIHLKVSRKWAEERLLLRGRSDDSTITRIDKRLDWFDQDTLPAIEYFSNNSSYKLLEIDAEKTKEQIHSDIIYQL